MLPLALLRAQTMTHFRRARHDTPPIYTFATHSSPAPVSAITSLLRLRLDHGHEIAVCSPRRRCQAVEAAPPIRITISLRCSISWLRFAGFVYSTLQPEIGLPDILLASGQHVRIILRAALCRFMRDGAHTRSFHYSWPAGASMPGAPTGALAGPRFARARGTRHFQSMIIASRDTAIIATREGGRLRYAFSPDEKALPPSGADHSRRATLPSPLAFFATGIVPPRIACLMRAAAASAGALQIAAARFFDDFISRVVASLSYSQALVWRAMPCLKPLSFIFRALGFLIIPSTGWSQHDFRFFCPTPEFLFS